MMEKARLDLIEETKKALQRMQDFDAQTLPREDDLGKQMSFKDAVEPAERLIDLYRQLPAEVVEALSTNLLNRIKTQANNDYNKFNQILAFQAGTPKGQRDVLVRQLVDAYDPAFDSLNPIISYSVRKSYRFCEAGKRG
jgi:hypothetical protein